MAVQIGPARPDDAEMVLGLLRVQYDEHGIVLAPERLSDAIAGALGHPERGTILVARDGVEVVGVAYLSYVWTLEHGGLSSWLEELFVVPSRRERGVGGALLAAAIEHARRIGCAAMDLEVEASHDRAAHLYSRVGFRRRSRSRWVRELGPA